MKKQLFSALCFLMLCMGMKAQVAAYSFSQSNGTYVPLPATGATTVHAIGWDDAVVTATIPFTFYFSGGTYTSCSVNTNGYLTFGASGATIYTPISNTTGYNGAVSAFARDLLDGAAGSQNPIICNTIGTAPNRTFIVQWTNVFRYSVGRLAGDAYNFQICLHEGGGVAATQSVSIVYGACTTTNTATGVTHQVGLRGAANTDFNNRNTATDWSLTTPGANNTASCLTTPAINPVSGLTFVYSPPAACVAPTAQATGLTFGGITGTAINGTYTAVSSGTAGYLVICTLGTAPNTPTNGVTYTTGTSAALAGTVVAAGTSTTFATTGLAGNTNYRYYIYSYAVNCTGGPVYNVTAPLTGTAVTCPATPGTGTVSALSTTGFNLAWGSSVGGGANPVTYTVDIATNNTFSSPVAGSPFVVTAPTNSVSVSGLTANTAYFYRISAGNGCNSAYTGTVSLTTPCLSTNVPYTQDFESVTIPAVPACTAVENVGTGNVWITSSPGTNGFTSKILTYDYHSSNAANTWFYLQGLNLTGGVSYRISYRYGTSSSFSVERLKINYGTASVAAAMTNTIADHPTISNNVAAANFVDFVPASTGVYYIGFNAYSIADQYNLFVDDILVQVSPTCFPPTGLTVMGSTTSTGTFSWTPPATGTPASYEYELRTSGAAGSGTTGLITTGTVSAPTTSVQVTGLSAGTTYSVYMRSNCGAGDISAWTAAPLVLATACTIVSVLPFFEDFETALTPAVPNCWTVIDSNNDGDKWITYNNVSYAKSGTKSVGLYTDYNNGVNNDWLITPQIVLTGNQQLKYWIRAMSSFEPNDYTVKLSTAGTATAAFTNTLLPVTSVSNTTYVEKIINLTGITGTVNIAFHIPAGGLDGYYLYIDDVTIERIPTCFSVTAVTATNTTVNTTSLGWTAPTAGTPVNYVWEIRTSGAAGSGATGLASTGTVVAPATSVTATGLSATTAYSVYVRTDCGSGDFSPWSTAKTFTTLAACPAPTTATVTNITGNRAVATWTAGATETAWDVYYGPTPLTAPTATTVPTATVGTTPSYTMTPLTSTTGYAVYVRANCGAGNTSVWSAVRNFTTAVSCPAPTTVVISAITPTSAVATWTAGGAETSWFVKYSAPTTTVVASGTPSYTMAGLTPSTTYSIQVKGICGVADSSAYTTLKTFMTPCLPPNITGTTPGTRCGIGTVTIGATGDPGASLKWYTAPTGGAAVATGSVFTTPTITNTTSYYVTATGGLSTEVGGRLTAVSNSGFLTNSGWGIQFNATQTFLLNSATIYPVGTGSVTIAMVNASGVELASTASIGITGSGLSTPVVVPLGFNVPVGTGYRLVLKAYSGITDLIRDISGTFPYNSPSGALSVTAGWTGSSSAAYYWFYNLNISIGCESARTAVAANVTAPPALALTATTTVCANVISTVSVTSTASNYDSYVWSPVTNLYTDAAATVPYAGGSAATLYYKSATAGSTSYNVNASNSVSGCANIASTMLNTSIPVINASLSPTVVCSGAAVTLSATTNAGQGAGTYGWQWNPGALSGNTVTVNPVNTGANATTVNYTVTATDPMTTCTNTAVVTVTVNPVPAMPTAVNSTQCGVGTPTASVSGGTNYKWYATSTSTTVLQAGTSPTFTSTIGSTATFYVSSYNTNCESGRVAVTASVTPADAITATSSSTVICAGQSFTLTAASTNMAYSYTWTATPATGSGIATSITGATTAVTPATPGSYNYLVTGKDAVCTTTAAVTVVSVAPPAIMASSTPSVLCSGSTATLNAVTTTISSGSLVIGNGTGLTTTTEELTAFCNRRINYRQQTLYTAAELTAAGLYTGNITSISYSIATIGDAATNANFTVKCGTVAATAFTDYVVSTGFTTVLPAMTYTHANGLNTITFSTPYFWDGVSNLVVEVSHDGINALYNAQTYYETLTSNRTVYGYNSATVGTLSTKRFNTILNGQVLTTSAGGVNWQWSPGAINSNTTTVSPTTTGTSITPSYTVTAIDPATTCSNTAVVTITVNPIPSVTVAASSSSLCRGASATLTASGATTYSWMPAGGSAAVAVVSPTATTVYTVTGTNPGCSDTKTISLNVTPTPTVVASVSPTVICAGTTVSLTASGATTYTWMPNSSTSGTTTATPIVSTTYSVMGTTAGCTNTKTLSVTVNNVPTLTVTATPASGVLCTAGATATLTAAGTSTSYAWNSGATTASISVAPSATTVYTVTGTNSCGVKTVTTSITVATTPTIAAMASSTLICPGNPAVLTASATPGVTFSWNTGASTASITVTPTTTLTYTVTGTNACGTATATVVQNVDLCIGIGEVTNAGGISIYPNPASDYVNIAVPMNLASANTSVELTDALGKLVMKETINTDVTTLRITELKDGVYFLKVISNNQTLKVGKVVKH